MPLPDERPRQSVANLIGRFENQTKRQSLPPPTGSPRSTSVLSNVTSDSTKEEVKEKREWPPKSTPSSEKASPIIPSSSWTRRTLAGALPSLPLKSELTDVLSGHFGESTRDTTKAPLPPEPETIAPAANPVVTPTSNVLKSPSKSAIPRSSLKPTPKSPPKQVPIAQPLKPQHTGSSSRKSVAKAPPATPIRSKTPSRPTPSSASRTKSPTSTIRPKTPSGLFAPTAASLARARNSQPLPPTPTKKTTLSSAVADRLSKPTAASLSRARTPSSAMPTPSRGGARGGATRGTPRVVSSGSTRAKKDTPSMPAAGTAAATAATVVVAVAAAGVGIAVTTESDAQPDGEQVYRENGHQENGHRENGHADTESHEEEIREVDSIEKPETVVHTDVLEPEEELDHHEEGLLGVDDGAVSLRVVESPLPHALDQPAVEEQEAEEPHVEEEITHVQVQDTSTTSSSDTQLVSEEPAEETKLHLHDPHGDGNDIEQMVHLLESSIPKARPLSIISIPDEVHEIPDEE